MLTPVALRARRLACAVRRRLVGVIPLRPLSLYGRGFLGGRIPAFYPIALVRKQGDRDRPSRKYYFRRRPFQTKRVLLLRTDRRGIIPSRGSGPQPSRMAIRVKVLSGPFNLADVGSPRPGDRRGRVLDQTRGSAETADREKLNHERPARACRSVPLETRGRAAKKHR